jgi:hypothetical protein
LISALILGEASIVWRDFVEGHPRGGFSAYVAILENDNRSMAHRKCDVIDTGSMNLMAASASEA